VTLDELVASVASGGPCDAPAVGRMMTSADVDAVLAAAPQCEGKKILTRANFSGVHFLGPVDFTGVRFVDDVSFRRAIFGDTARFCLIESSRCFFQESRFNGEVYADLWTAGILNFEETTFNALARFYRLTADTVSFSGTRFNGQTAFGDIKAGTFFNFVGVVFAERIRDFVSGTRFLHLQQSRLERGGVFYLHGGQVALAGAELGAATMIAGSRKSGQLRNQDDSLIVDGGGWRPRLLSLEEVDAVNLTLQDVDLSRCDFVGVMNLDQLQLEGVCLFDTPPTGIFAGGTPPWIWSCTKRMIVHEERVWRSHSSRPNGWRIRPAMPGPGEPLIVSAKGDPFARAVPPAAERRAEAEQLAKVYRALRKGREAARNEPGAGDFYYGEMEMRRAGNASRGERFVIWLYWLISGYGLRPLRSLLALIVLLAVCSAILAGQGFIGAHTYSDALLASLAAAINLEYLKTEAFTVAGQWTRILLRILGPTLFGLMLLALWGRVKR
jgi:uncharacterized protein YjbI with pentapeptide repeats